MGLFSTSKQVLVDSVVYNLAGPPEQRPEYLKTALMSAVFNPVKVPIGESLTNSLLRGPGINLRAFGRWARTQGYSTLVGQTEGTLLLPLAIDQGLLATLVPQDPGQIVSLQTSTIGVADFTYWAHKYMLENHPDLMNTAYTASYDKVLDEITIVFVDTSTVTFATSDFADYDIGSLYLYVSYNRADPESFGSITTGTPVTVAGPGSYPSTSGWTLIDTLYDSGAGWTSVEYVWQRDTYLGWTSAESGTTSLREIMHFIEVTDTGTMITTYEHRTDEQTIVHISQTPLELFIYKEGSGNTDLDAFFASTTDKGDFLPYIPVRVDNQFVSDSYLSDILTGAEKALKKSNGASFEEIITQIEDNANLADIDYAFLVFGASLNTEDNASKRYLYQFFQYMMLGEDLSTDSFSDWETEYAAAQAADTAWQAWSNAQQDSGDPLYGDTIPNQAVFPPLPYYEVRVRSTGRPEINYDMAVGWNSIQETTGSGLKIPTAKKGDLWWEVLPRETVNETLNSVDLSGDPFSYTQEKEMCRVKFHWQVTDSSWRTLDFRGLEHRNRVYKGSYVIIQADEALADARESGFIIPIHEDILRDLPLVVSTQLSVSCFYLVFNCYKEVSTPWYASTWFKLVLFVVMIGVAMLTGYLDPNAVGLLGANAVVGATAGLTGVAAAMAGAVANALAAAMITQVLGLITTSILGPKFGAIVSTAIMILLMGASFSGGLPSVSEIGTNILNKLAEVENLLKLTLSVGNIYTAVMKEDTQDILRKTQDVIRDYTIKTQEIMSRMEAFDGAADVMNPLQLTDVELFSGAGSSFMESPETFFNRTLMTGSEIAEASFSMVSDFTSNSLSTDLPI
jgi:hypothetical protein